MIKMKQLVESFDNPYKYTGFKTELIDYEDEETGETYKKDVLSPVQIVKFTSDNGVPYIWYARQNVHNDKAWEIAFGVNKGENERGAYQLDIGITGGGNVMRIFSTVIDIINSFIEFDGDNYEIMWLTMSSKGDKRTRIYTDIILPRIEKLKIDHISKSGDTTDITMIRVD